MCDARNDAITRTFGASFVCVSRALALIAGTQDRTLKGAVPLPAIGNGIWDRITFVADAYHRQIALA